LFRSCETSLYRGQQLLGRYNYKVGIFIKNLAQIFRNRNKFSRGFWDCAIHLFLVKRMRLMQKICRFQSDHNNLLVENITDQQITEVSSITHAHNISCEACKIYVHIAKSLITGKSIQEAIKEKLQKAIRFSHRSIILNL